jgi:hypothetical protein
MHEVPGQQEAPLPPGTIDERANQPATPELSDFPVREEDPSPLYTPDTRGGGWIQTSSGRGADMHGLEDEPEAGERDTTYVGGSEFYEAAKMARDHKDYSTVITQCNSALEMIGTATDDDRKRKLQALLKEAELSQEAEQLKKKEDELDEIRIKSMVNMVERIQILDIDRNETSEAKLLYLTNHQAALFDSKGVPRLMEEFDVDLDKVSLVIRLMDSDGAKFYETVSPVLNEAEEASFYVDYAQVRKHLPACLPTFCLLPILTRIRFVPRTLPAGSMRSVVTTKKLNRNGA